MTWDHLTAVQIAMKKQHIEKNGRLSMKWDDFQNGEEDDDVGDSLERSGPLYHSSHEEEEEGGGTKKAGDCKLIRCRMWAEGQNSGDRAFYEMLPYYKGVLEGGCPEGGPTRCVFA